MAKRVAETSAAEADERLTMAKAVEAELNTAVAASKASAEGAAAACAAAEAREARLSEELSSATAELQRAKQHAAIAINQTSEELSSRGAELEAAAQRVSTA